MSTLVKSSFYANYSAMRHILILSIFILTFGGCQRPSAISDSRAEPPSLSKAEVTQTRQVLHSGYSKQLLRKKDAQWDQRELQHSMFNMPFFYKKWGNAPAGGYPLFISMHGGGGAPAAVNDQQYQNHLHIYVDDRMLDLNRPITIKYKGNSIFKGKVNRKRKHLAETLARKGAPHLSFCSRITIINNTDIKLN